jgi:hypothetical protein
MRHGLAATREDLEGEEGEWIIAAVGTVINPLLAETRLHNVTARKAWGFPCFKTKPF